jgi:HEAT repeat protein
VLVDALTVEDARVRRSAVGSLGQLGDPKAIDPLVERLGDEDTEARRLARA